MVSEFRHVDSAKDWSPLFAMAGMMLKMMNPMGSMPVTMMTMVMIIFITMRAMVMIHAMRTQVMVMMAILMTFGLHDFVLWGDQVVRVTHAFSQ